MSWCLKYSLSTESSAIGWTHIFGGIAWLPGSRKELGEEARCSLDGSLCLNVCCGHERMHLKNFGSVGIMSKLTVYFSTPTVLCV